MHVTVSWKGKMAFEGLSGSGHRVMADARPEVGGENRGPSPMELVLIGLGGCTGMDVVSILEKMRVSYDDFKISISAERKEEHPKTFSRVSLLYEIWGKDVPEDKLKRAVDLTQEKYCSVLHMVNKTAAIEYSYKIHQS
ncbi:OsmC family protein [Zhaonella formicivorans]|jgi:putative redox protein|uniref:OsmC family protein n=1 Tax=Zhaonella formicivorans TaxID=2528593 RepID=UPI0010D12439|nr:OsmC family protein [Zhaonella formicivorans]